MSKLSFEEKRLQAITKQLLGKQALADKNTTHARSSHSSLDVTYLKKDLVKILILATLAIGGQLILYSLLKTGSLVKFGIHW